MEALAAYLMPVTMDATAIAAAPILTDEYAPVDTMMMRGFQ